MSQTLPKNNQFITTTVVKGHGRGKFLGYPTLNLTIPKTFNYDFGIYAGQVQIDSQTFLGAFHFGPVPTFDQSQPSLEVFVLNTHLPSTPQEVKFHLSKRLRSIIHFDSIQELTHQITQDVEQIKNLYTSHDSSQT